MGNFLSPLLLSIHVNLNSCGELSSEEYQAKENFLYHRLQKRGRTWMSCKNGIYIYVTLCTSGAQRAKITEKVHKPPLNHYLEWPVFSDIGLNCESQVKKGRTCTKYKILIGSRVFFFHFTHDLPFSPGHLLESEERFVNLFCNFSPLCGAR